MNQSEIEKGISCAAAGIDRFFDEGYTKWPEDKFRVLFCGAALEEDAVQNILAVWEKSGAIKIRREPNCFVEIIHPIY